MRLSIVGAESCTLMDKAHPSRKHQRPASFWLCFVPVFFIAISLRPLSAITLSQSEALRIGKKIWQNECNGTVSGLTSWNPGEDFASLGIGHFIWYPEGKRGPFEESFPRLISFISQQHADVPPWLQNQRACPWRSQSEFDRAQTWPAMTELRYFLARTVDLQAQFFVDRLEHAL